MLRRRAAFMLRTQRRRQMSPYANRQAAGIALAQTLRRRALGGKLIILGLPRGGVPVAFEVARALRAPLDVMVVRKIGMPGHEELAIGAVAIGGVVVRDVQAAALAGIDEHAFEALAAAESRELERRERRYRAGRPALDLKDRTVLLVDDGIATGSTMTAAVRAAGLGGAGRIVVAAPVASTDAIERVEREADEVIVLHAPYGFMAVGEWYVDFGQTQDDDVVDFLARAATFGMK
jgi:predicted phosphoribosyltransferase